MTINLTSCTSSPANHACLLSVSSRHASSWLAVIPSKGLNLNLEPEEFQLNGGLGRPHHSRYVALTDLNPLGYHVVTCKLGGDVVVHHIA